ncbi:hypothetical protein DENSPDRAFT_383194 [Dentipellis sp. KUC8613]|nr:hypothetical protein DENSPDRAFT_383194 [Dentipellis sp. KUC8613]
MRRRGRGRDIKQTWPIRRWTDRDVALSSVEWECDSSVRTGRRAPGTRRHQRSDRTVPRPVSSPHIYTLSIRRSAIHSSSYLPPMDNSALPSIITTTSPYSPYPRDSPTTSESSFDSPVQAFPGTFLQQSLLPPASPTLPSHQSKVAHMHPYARLASKKDGSKRRKIWNHALEKSIFTSQELSTMGAPSRRTIYIATLEAHIDQLHAQLYDMNFYPVPLKKLEPFTGLNCKTAKSMVAGLHHDASQIKMKLLEIERANTSLEDLLLVQNADTVSVPCCADPTCCHCATSR